MLITGRQARAVLLPMGVSERRTRTALSCGLAGEPVRTSAANLYDSARVFELGGRPVVSPDMLLQHCPSGCYISRIPVPVGVDPEKLRSELAVVPGQMSPWTALSLVFPVGGGLPLVATVAGFVVMGATIRGIRGRRLVLDVPGAWFAELAGGQLLTGNGRQWKILDPGRALAS